MKRWLAMLLTALLLTSALAEPITVELPADSLEALFGLYCWNEETQEHYVLPSSAEYANMVLSYAQRQNFTQTVNGLKFTALRSIALNDLYALEWRVENVSGEPRFLLTGGLQINGDLDGAYSAHDLSENVLMPGEVRTGFAKKMATGITGESCTLGLVYLEYFIREDVIQWDHSGWITPEESDIQMVCESGFEIVVHRTELPELALDESCYQTEQTIGEMTLRLTDAHLSVSGGTFSFEGVFDTCDEAGTHNPCGEENPWFFALCSEEEMDGESAQGEGWIEIGGGEIPEAPVQLDDGRWAWQITLTAEFLHALPDTIYLVIETDSGKETASKCFDKAIEMRFSAN